MTLAQQLRELADVIEDTNVNEVDSATLSFRMDEDEARVTDAPVGQVDAPYDGTVMCSIFTEDIE